MWMAPAILYTCCVIGAFGLYLLARPTVRGVGAKPILNAVGGLLALLAFGWLVIGLTNALGKDGEVGGGILHVAFSAVALIAAAKMITHKRPVYSALYFVLVVLASAGMFLLLDAEFMAFALIIVYAGAILITYMFVLMLAQQAPNPDDPESIPEYDRHAREPAAGALVGFILLALLCRMISDGSEQIAPRRTSEQAVIAGWERLEAMPKKLRGHVDEEVEGEFTLGWGEDQPLLTPMGDAGGALVYYLDADGTQRTLRLSDDVLPDNIQSVGMALILDFPVSLELAGVILLMAMFGAVMLARKQIELTEDDTREAAGLPRIGHHDEPGGECVIHLLADTDPISTLTLAHFLLTSAALFVIGLIGFLTRRNLIVMFLCTELMFQAAAIAMIAFGRFHSTSRARSS
jgi:NADH-quinone oxidoreductase subunit J